LHRANYTYKQAASELCITPNTVKKHMKNIYLKQKSIFENQDD
jgi:DNA-binding CsgD family transcriptional regulator